ncbi:ribosome small subunit-dependent GTPase A [Bdellovibrio sp. HCB290]|uniref:ribosome small subunit-dependent GTPase A n=1 Tax=Bdellovibrio sp. HCB290 TaxID=3394356 RepID=UPI0039B47F46
MSTYSPFLSSLGWNDFFQASFDKVSESGLYPARIIGQGRGHYYLQVTANDVLEGVISTRLFKASKAADDFPTVGDWVAFTPSQGQAKAEIHHVLSRQSYLGRRRSGNENKTQHLASNVDHLLVVTSLNEDFDLERIGRYLEIGKDSGASTHILLTKLDLCAHPEEYVQKIRNEFGDIEIFLISSLQPQSMDELKKFFIFGKTSVLLGSSGVGKSTLSNYLTASDGQVTGELGIDSKGKHTTTSRNILRTRWDGLVIDTPGMQEVLAIKNDTEESSSRDFSDVEQLTLECKFTNCRHQNDPGCAISAALKANTLSTERWAAYQKALSKIKVPKKKWQK